MRWTILFAAVALAGCNQAKIAYLEKQIQDLKAQVDQQTKLVDLDTQAKCATAAKVFFNSNWLPHDPKTILLDYTNHYNKKVGKCFIMVEWHFNDSAIDGSWFNVEEVHDVFENNQYARFSERHSLDVVTHDQKHQLVACDVDGRKCTSNDEFVTRTAHFMVE
jgi:hypothetical protein